MSDLLRILGVLALSLFIGAAVLFTFSLGAESARRKRENRPCETFANEPLRAVPLRCLREGDTRRDTPYPNYW